MGTHNMLSSPIIKQISLIDKVTHCIIKELINFIFEKEKISIKDPVIGIKSMSFYFICADIHCPR
jgi:hypothetical protein